MQEGPAIRRSLKTLAVLLLSSGASVLAADFTVLFSGRVAGEMTTTDQDGGRRMTYKFVDRGRGPELVSTVRLGDRALPSSVTVEGVDYFKTPVTEQMATNGVRREWRSAAGNGSADTSGFYLASSAVPEHLAMLARAALAAGGEVAMLPAGRARIERVLEHRPTSVPNAEPVTLYFIHGLQFVPQPIWLDAKGELALLGATWNNAVRKDLQAASPELIKIQEAEATKREMAQAPGLARKPTGPVLFRNAALFDSEAKTLRRNMSVLVQGNRIAAVGPTASLQVPAGAEVIDAAGKTLVPGMWDMHVHVGSNYDGLLHLGAGVTSVRDMAMDMDELRERRRRFDTGELVGPRIEMAGFIDGPGPFAGPSKALVDTPEGVREWVNRYADAGYKQIKLYSSLKTELVPVAVEAAHSRGLRVSGHIPSGMTMEDAVRAGFDEVQHANFWFLNFMGPEINKQTQTTMRFHAVGRHAHEVALDGPATTRLIELLKSKGTVLDPTIVTFEGLFSAKPGEPSPELAAIADRLPAAVQRGAMAGQSIAADNEMRETYSRAFKRMPQMLKRLYDAGITIVPGTDAMPGFTYHRELEIYAGAGIPTVDVLQMATLGAARVMKRDHELGSIAAGKLADLVLIDGDPTARMSDIRNTALVMKDGTIFDPNALHQAIGIRPRTASTQR